MARPQAIDYDDKRGLIATKAAELFAKQGASNTSLTKVAVACEMSKSLIYHYYQSKEEILFDVMNSHMEELISIIDEINSAQYVGEEAFRAFSRALMKHYVGAANSQKVLLYELDNVPSKNRTKIVSKQRKLIAFAENLLVNAAGGNDIDKAELRARIMLFFGMLNWSHSWFNPNGKIDRYQLADLASDITIKGTASPT